MKLNWFVPLTPTPGRVSRWLAQVLPSLGRRAEVRCVDADAVSWAEVLRADLSIYHIADDPAYGGIWEVSRRHPGVVVLHDIALPRLFTGHFRGQPDGELAYRSAMDRYYGDAGRWLAQRIWDGRVPVDFLSDHCPLTELAVDGALGVLVHNQSAYDALWVNARWPIAYLPLGCDAEVYVDGLVRLIEEAERCRACAAGYHLAERAAAAMRPWAGPYGERMSERVAKAIANFV